ncbi:hypothetical protein JXB41_03015 [Candidatus Woesearchaeota archaeon]|nr:hypothetical protein [Candidatus Woesearchaeota archaeon]
MMQKLWQKKLKLNYSKDIFDIVQFGSSVMENSSPNDIDIAVIFKNIPVKFQLNHAQNIKKQLKEKTELPIHIKSFDLYSFFDPGNFARENILFYGKSLITEKYFAERFGLKPKIQISYSLQKLVKKDKVRFHYMLKGKKNNSGLLNKYNGELLNPGLIEIMPEYEQVFIKNIEKITKEYEAKRVLY